MSLDPASQIKAILAHYDLGELFDYERNDRGFVNTSYAIDTVLQGVRTRRFLRRYKKGIRPEELEFEHGLIEHLAGKNFACVAKIHKTRAGNTYLHWFEDETDPQGEFVAIFDFLPGEDRFTWVNPLCDVDETRNAAALLAQFHSLVSDLVPRGRRSEARILELLPLIETYLENCSERSKQTAFDACLQRNLPLVLANLRETRQALASAGVEAFPQLVIHCDYHPGNLKFLDRQIVGFFDFDWSKVDLRLFDVGLAIWYFCTAWEGDQDGQLRLDQAGHFLEAYQQASHDEPGVGPLSEPELAALPHMINTGNLYILNWTVQDYFQKNVDPEEYLKYLQHSIRFTRWFAQPENRHRLERRVLQLGEMSRARGAEMLKSDDK